MPPRSPNESLASNETHHRRSSSTENILNDLRRSAATSTPVNPNKQRSRANDHATMRSDDSAAAPTSVYLGSAVTLTRELSDLSGSYVNGAASRGGPNSKGTGAVPGHIYDDANTFKGPWRHAFVLSEQPPPQVVRQQQHSANGSGGGGGIVPSKPRADATIFVDRNDFVEVVKQQDSISDQVFGGRDMAADSLNGGSSIHKRIPIMVLLMHPSEKTYEIMQLWANQSTDSVRDVVNTMHKSIPMKWKQAYDGIFQMRGNKLTQLIHILSLEKYEIQPHEILVAKPWSMPSNVTISYATSLIRHLTNTGMVCSSDSDMCGQRIFRPTKSVDASLLLSSKAQSRIFAPEGVLNHHHAVQFVTFSPPMDPNRLPVDIVSEPRTESGSHSSVSLLHDSIDDFDPFLKLNLKQSNGTDISAFSPPQQRPSSSRTLSNRGLQRLPSLEPTAEHQPRRSILSKLNCCRNKDDGNRNNNNTSSVTSPVLTLTEEQQRRWSTFDITGPIAEDNDFQSVAAFSVSQSSSVSMSAPLLMSQKSSYRRVSDNRRGSPAKRRVTKADF